MQKVFEDWRTAPISEELRAALGFVEAMTLRPTELDAGPMRAAGLTDNDIETVAAVCAAFNIIVRIADSLEFEVPTDDEFARMAPKMAARNYA
ncbi:MAG: carboxymuconolactone decarboxylase family protein [Planctomycetota bacterium]